MHGLVQAQVQTGVGMLLPPQWWWFVAGLLIGLLLWWLYDVFFCRKGYQSEISMLKTETTTLRGATAEVEGLRTENGRLKADLDGAKKEFGDWRLWLAGALGAGGAALSLGDAKNRFAAVQTDLGGLKTENEKLKAELGTLRASAGDYNKLQADFGGIKAENDKLKADFGGLKSENDKLKAELGTLRGSAGDYGKLQGDYASLKAENDNLKLDLDGSKKEFGDWRGWLAGALGLGAAGTALSLGDAKNRLATVEGDSTRLKGENDSLKAELATLRAGAGDYGKLQADYDGLKGQLDGAHSENEQLKAEMTGLRARSGDYTKLQADFNGVMAENARLKGDLDGTKKEFGDWRLWLTGLMGAGAAGVALSQNDAKAKYDDMQAELNSLRARSGEYDSLKANFATTQQNLTLVERDAKLWKRAGVVITYLEFDPPGKDIDGEYVTIRNGTARPVDMTGWTLRDDNNKHVYTFPAFTLGAGDEVQLWSKKGENDAANLYWGNAGAIWNNTGDTASLLDDEGHEISRYSYDGKTARKSPLTLALGENEKLKAEVTTLRASADSGAALRNDYDLLQANFATVQANFATVQGDLTAAQREAKLWKRAGVVVTYVEFDPPGKDIDGEYVLIHNGTARAVDMTGWTLRDDNNKHVYTFPAFTLGAGEEVQLWSKKGENDAANLYWGNAGAIWNNTGDTASLLDDEGHEISRYSYDGTTASKSPLARSISMGNKLQADMATLRVKADEGSRLRAEYDRLKADYATTHQNLTTAQREAKLWKRAGVVITYLEFDPPGKDIDGEYVTIRNGTARPVTLTGWKLRDDNNKHVFTFPEFTLGAGDEVQLWSKKGENDAANLFWGNWGAIWNNTGDTALLLDEDGNEISRYSYDGKTARKSPLTLALGENEKLKAELAALSADLSKVKVHRRDPLRDVNGIGPVYEKRLFDAGVTTFERLSQLKPEEIKAIIKPQDWQALDFEAWIAEAKEFAERVKAGTYQSSSY